MYLLLRNLLLISCLLLSNISYGNPKTDYPLTLYDASKHKVTLHQAPTRIDSKSMFTDQVIIALLPAKNIVGLSRFSNDPTYSVIANKIPKGIPLLDLNVEQIIATQPDLVLVASWSNHQKIALLRATGINVFVLKTVYSLKNIEKNILTVGQLLNRNQEAKKLIATMKSKLKKDVIIPKKRLTAIEYTPWGASSNRNSTINTIIEQAQLNNVIAASNGDKFGQVPIAKEQLLVLDPDVIIVPGDNDTNNKFREQLLKDPALQTLTAIKKQQVITLPNALRATDSQYITDAIIFLNHQVYQHPHAQSSTHQ